MINDEVHDLSEFEAYKAAEGTGPDYSYRNCGRFSSYACPR
jgi:hypothetical protein